ncbi:MAG TPA: thymidine phosphorylase [Parvularcula sp.]|jgi:thymidine phosphorylase|nr:thymidine phosphorylase [Parvularcula sp.]
MTVTNKTEEAPGGAPVIRARRLGLFTQDDVIVLMRSDCHLCRAEGLAARSRVLLSSARGEVIATLYQVENDWLAEHEAALSEAAWARLGLAEGEPLQIRQAPPVPSFGDVRRRIYGGRLDARAFTAIVSDISGGRYSDIHLATFLSACSALPLDRDEMIHLTRAMVNAGDRLSWPTSPVVDKHCVGGLPGNRTTPIIVAIVASLGLVMPKTSSRAITSPAGTADVMETLAPVDLDLARMRRVVEAEGACLAWGGAVHLSPADDILIRIERALDIDTEGQLVASVLSKKIAAGATHVVFDLPVGPSAKVRSPEAARSLSENLSAAAAAFGLRSRCVITDGSQPIGRGLGPALEARDVLAVLQNAAAAPEDLRERALALAGAALELAGTAREGEGRAMALRALVSGQAWAKFQRICEAQGGMRVPPRAPLTRVWPARGSGRLARIDNRKISRLAKLTGAPDDKAAGVELHVRLSDAIAAGQPLLSLHAEAEGRLDYAMEYALANLDMFELES